MTKKKLNKGDSLPELLASLTVLGVLLLICAAFSAWSCSSKWSDSGFVTKWGPIAGCRISQDGNRYIPEDRYREIAE